MLAQLGRHGSFDLTVRARGDLHVDAHHTVEDVGIVLGEALAEALGDKAGVRRFASIALPLDEALVDVALDLSGRPYLAYDVAFAPDTAGLGTPPFDPQLAEEFWRALVTAAGVTLHVRLVTGKNTHHVLEASFKGVARCLRDAVPRGWCGCALHQGRAGQRRRGLTWTEESPSSTTASATWPPPTRRFVHLGRGRPARRPTPTTPPAAGWSCPGWAPSGLAPEALRSTGPRPCRGRRPGAGGALSRHLRRLPAALRRLRGIPGGPGARCPEGDGAGLAAGGQAPPDAVEPARHPPRDRQSPAGRGGAEPVGVLRPLLRSRALRRRRGDM